MTELVSRLMGRASYVVLATSIAILGTAFAFEYLADLRPCVLCIYQRYPYGVTIVLSAVAVGQLLAGRPRAEPYLLIAVALALMVGVGIAAFHVGVEQGWWQGTAACGALGSPPENLEALKAQLLAAPIVRCDEVAWSLFGISMAGYNFLLSLGLAGFALLAARAKLLDGKRA